MASAFILLVLLVVDSSTCVQFANLLGSLGKVSNWLSLVRFGYTRRLLFVRVPVLLLIWVGLSIGLESKIEWKRGVAGAIGICAYGITLFFFAIRPIWKAATEAKP